MGNQINVRHSRIVVLPIIAALSFGCTSTTPTIDTGPDAEVTFDGLYPITGSRADVAWAKPGVDLSLYTKIKLEGAGIEYRPGGEAGRTWHARSRGGPYEVTEQQKDRFRNLVGEVFLEELSKSERYTIVNESGPDVLLIRGAILDVVSYVPPDAVSGRVDVYLSAVGEATLVIEIRDSITDAILARAVDRDLAEQTGGIMMESNRVTNRAEVRRLVRRWASLLRERLDELGAPAS